MLYEVITPIAISRSLLLLNSIRGGGNDEVSDSSARTAADRRHGVRRSSGWLWRRLLRAPDDVGRRLRFLRRRHDVDLLGGDHLPGRSRRALVHGPWGGAEEDSRTRHSQGTSVITSYSIHYTKLYDRRSGKIINICSMMSELGIG